MATQLRDRDWDVILDNIEAGRCIVQLGPDLCTLDEHGEKRNLAVELAHELAQMLAEDRSVSIHDPHNLRLVAQIYQSLESRDYLVAEAKRFYRRYEQSLAEHPNPTFEHLAALPFRLYVTSRHDATLDHFLKQQDRTPIVRSYHFKGNRTANLGELGSLQQPLVYRLYGDLDERDSMVLTENDLLDFLVAVVSGNPGLPTDLVNLFADRSFLFLGFGLGSYYLRILLHVLSLNKSHNSSFALENPPLPEVQAAFERNFKESVFFYDKLGYRRLKLLDIALDDFIRELRGRWDERHPEGWRAVPERSEGDAPDSGPSVFISYVKEDEVRATQLVERLCGEGLNPWIDKQGLRGGMHWNHVLDDAISKEVDYFIVLLSRELNDRRETFVHKEVKLALERQELRTTPFIFPVQIDQDSEPLDAILRAKIQFEPLYNDWDRDVKRLAKEIKRDYERQRKRG